MPCELFHFTDTITDLQEVACGVASSKPTGSLAFEEILKQSTCTSPLLFVPRVAPSAGPEYPKEICPVWDSGLGNGASGLDLLGCHDKGVHSHSTSGQLITEESARTTSEARVSHGKTE